MQESRLFRIVYYLIEKGKSTAPELAQKFEVSARTIYRDIDVISSAGIPIYATQGKNGGIIIDENFTLDRSMLSKKEKEQILSGLQALFVANSNNTNELLTKLGALFHLKTTNWIEVDFSDWIQGQPAQNIFNDIKTAILDKYIILRKLLITPLSASIIHCQIVPEIIGGSSHGTRNAPRKAAESLKF